MDFIGALKNTGKFICKHPEIPLLFAGACYLGNQAMKQHKMNFSDLFQEAKSLSKESLPQIVEAVKTDSNLAGAGVCGIAAIGLLYEESIKPFLVAASNAKFSTAVYTASVILLTYAASNFRH